MAPFAGLFQLLIAAYAYFLPARSGRFRITLAQLMAI